MDKNAVFQKLYAIVQKTYPQKSNQNPQYTPKGYGITDNLVISNHKRKNIFTYLFSVRI